MAPKTGMVAVMHYLEIPAAKFRAEWGKLTPADKNDLKDGIGTFDPDTHEVSGPLTY
jgi:hypothetical protein